MDRSWASVVTAAMLAFVACTGGGSASTSPSAATSRTPEAVPSEAVVSPTVSPVDVARSLKRLPEHCPGPDPHPEPVAPAYAPLVGGRPAWAGFYARLDRSRGGYHALNAPRTKVGWRVKVLWVVAPQQRTPVSLSGSGPSGQPISFQVSDGGEGQPFPVGLLDPAEARIGDGHWQEFSSYLFFPSAGCYRLEAEWTGGSWHLGFGFGR